jgi:hypothetical protein
MARTSLVTLVRGGRPRFDLARLPWQSAQDLMEPADELLRCLRCSVGAAIPVAPHRPNAPPAQPVTLALRWEPESDLGDEAFELEATPRRVELRARTPAGLSHAVYWFLETFVGVRWLWPGASGEVIPHCRHLAVPLGRQRHQPDYHWRCLGIGGAIYQAMDYVTAEHAVLGLPLSFQQDLAIWCRRNRLGGIRVADGHRWSQIAPPETCGSTHPAWYALVDGRRDCQPHDGKHGNQPCLTHPAVTRRMVDYACARFAAQPELNALSIALNDSDNPCQCRACLALDRACRAEQVAYADELAKQTHEGGKLPVSHRSITDRVFWQANRVARAVAARYTDRKLLIHLYGHYRMPPVTQSLDARVIGQYCVMGFTFWDRRIRTSQLRHLRAMGQRVRSLGIYEYYANGKWPESHRLFPELVETSVRAYHRAGARYFATQPTAGFATNGLNLFVLARCLWDVGTRSTEVVDDFCRSGFGAGWRHVRRCLLAFAQRWRQTRSGLDLGSQQVWLQQAQLYPRAFLAQRSAELAAARRATRGDRAAQARVAFLQQGLAYTTLLAAAADASLTLCRQTPLDAQGLPLLPDSPVAARRTRRRALAAHRAWSRYWSFVRRHAGQFVFGDFWVHYRPGLFGRKDPLQQRIRERAQIAS